MPIPTARKKRIAIVGTGVAGLATLYSLRNRCETDCDIFLFEKDIRLGGHTNTQEWICSDSSERVPVDTGFIVINSATYRTYLQSYDCTMLNGRYSQLSQFPWPLGNQH